MDAEAAWLPTLPRMKSGFWYGFGSGFSFAIGLVGLVVTLVILLGW